MEACYPSLFYPLLGSANPYLIHWRTQTRFSHCLNLNFCQISTEHKMHTEVRAQPQHPHRLHSWAELSLYCNHPHTKFCNSLTLWKLKCVAVLLWPQLHIFPFHLWGQSLQFPSRWFPVASLSCLNLIHERRLLLQSHPSFPVPRNTPGNHPTKYQLDQYWPLSSLPNFWTFLE